MKKILVLVSVASGLMTGCGPMNTKPIDSKAVQNSQCNGAVAENSPKVSFVSGRPFLLLAQLKANADADPTTTQVKPQKGDNQYVVKLVHLQDPRKTSEIALTSVSYAKENAHVPQTYQGTIEKQTNGTYLVSFSFNSKKFPATYDVTFSLVDGDVKDEQKLSVTIEE